MTKFYLIVLGLIQIAFASYQSHNVTIEYILATDELHISAYVQKDTWFAVGWGKTMDNGGGILFRGDHEYGNSSAFYMKGHDTPVPNPVVKWYDVIPPKWDGQNYFFSVRRPMDPTKVPVKHPIVTGHHGKIVPAPVEN